MIKANISEIKNRLSYYLKLVKGGEQVEIIDRKTPLARIVRIGDLPDDEKRAPWVKEMYDLGIIIPPTKRDVSSLFLSIDQVSSEGENTSGILEALLKERDSSR